jgi:hypothetical protein
MDYIEGGTVRALILTAALLGSQGCAYVGDILNDPRYEPRHQSAARSVVIDGELSSVEPRKGRIRVRTQERGMRTVYMDRATRVFYQRQEYRVDALERGDLVRVWVELNRDGSAWADRVEVREGVNERRRDRY